MRSTQARTQVATVVFACALNPPMVRIDLEFQKAPRFWIIRP
jgi:hypothetical protein